MNELLFLSARDRSELACLVKVPGRIEVFGVKSIILWVSVNMPNIGDEDTTGLYMSDEYDSSELNVVDAYGMKYPL